MQEDTPSNHDDDAVTVGETAVTVGETAVAGWLVRWRRRCVGQELAWAFLCLVGSAVILWLTKRFFAGFFVLLFGDSPMEGWVFHSLGWAMIPLLFLGYWTSKPEDLHTYRLVSAEAYFMDVLKESLTPRTVRHSRYTDRDAVEVAFILDMLYVGPRLVVYGIKVIRETRKFWRMDLNSCASVLALLANSDGKVSYQSILEQVGEDAAADVFLQLRNLKGVLFLSADPPGLTLLPDLRETLRSL